MATTARNMTDLMVQQLKREAAEHGDFVQVYICEVALGTQWSEDERDSDGTPDYSGVASQSEMQRIRELRDMTQEQAWAECAKVIAAAAQAEAR